MRVPPLDTPPSYERFKTAWRENAEEAEQRDEQLDESVSPQNTTGEEQLADAVQIFARRFKELRFKPIQLSAHDAQFREALSRIKQTLEDGDQNDGKSEDPQNPDPKQ